MGVRVVHAKLDVGTVRRVLDALDLTELSGRELDELHTFLGDRRIDIENEWVRRDDGST